MKAHDLGRHAGRCLVSVSMSLGLSTCGGDITASQAYQQACHGAPLANQQAVYQAEADGYRINSRYRCIDRQSWQEVQQALARIEHVRRPDVMAQREAEADREHARRLAGIAERATAREQAAQRSASVMQAVQVVDANRGTHHALAALCSVGDDGAAAIVQARQQGGPFRDWADLVHRVVPFSAAQSAVAASCCGLTVQGSHLPGAEPSASAVCEPLQRQRQSR
jgi:DNA uptake protein ComE-like DNA-binding protein